jgi:nitrate reductase gamma subunit
MSLLLFEHIHGESRDRGQAMVDLLATYRGHGFELGVKQLPDYLPVVLEYLSLRPVEEVRDWLSHVAHILELLAARAQERGSPYAVLLETLVETAAGKLDLAALRTRVASEERDDTPEAIDRVWEEEAVRFGAEAPGEECNPPDPTAVGREADRTHGDAMNYIDTLLFQFYPYLALAVFAIGCWARFDHAAYTWRSGSSQLLSGKWMRLGSNWFHIGILAILGGHLVGLLTPHALYEHFITAPQKQLVAMVVGGIFGVICFIGLTILLARRLFNPRIRATSSGRDILILVLLYIQLILGLSSIFVSAGHMDGAQMIALGEWAQHIVTFRGGAAAYIADAHWIFKTHVFLGMTLILLTPFTRLVHVWSIPVGYLTRPYQVVRKRQRPLQYPVR